MTTAGQTRRGLLRWLSATTTPVFVLDARRVVLFFNQGCERLTGWTAGDLIGRVCEYATDTDPQDVAGLANRLCPPPEVFAGQPRDARAGLLHRDGRTLPVLIRYMPLPADDGSPLHVLGFILPTMPADTEQASGESDSAELHARLAEVRDDLRRGQRVETLIGLSPPMRRVLEQVRAAGACDAAVHLVGEGGAGKQHVARAIHLQSDQRLRAFVPIDCEALPSFELKRTLRRLFESQPGDETNRPAMQPGTLYLRQAGSLPRDLQERVTAFYAEGTHARRRLRLVSSDERSLRPLLESDALQPEFYYLLSELVIEMTALRERREDLPLLAQHFLEETNRGAPQQVGGFTAEAWNALNRYNWPGNVSELEAVVREAREACGTPLISPRDLPFRFRTGMDAQAIGPSRVAEPIDLEAALAAEEARHIRWALEQAKSNKSRAAALLGLTRPRLYRRMEALGLLDGSDETGNDAS